MISSSTPLPDAAFAGVVLSVEHAAVAVSASAAAAAPTTRARRVAELFTFIRVFTLYLHGQGG